MFEILDGLIATVAVVLVLSLIVQGIQQIVKQAWSFKSKYMEQELLAMFILVRSVDSKTQFTRNPILRSLQALWQFLKPSRSQFKKLIAEPQNEVYVGILDLVRARLASIGYDDLSLLETMNSQQFVALLQDIRDGLSEEVKWTFDLTFAQAIDDARKWFDLTMKAFQDHYQRRMRIWSYALSALVVVWLNANLFVIYEEFSSNKVLRDSAVQMAGRLAAAPKDSLIAGVGAGGSDSIARGDDSLAIRRMESQISRIHALVNSESFQMFRWNTTDGDTLVIREAGGIRPGMFISQFLCAAGKNWLGWLVMTLLVGLGAPFWYDILKTIMGIKDKLKSAGSS